MQYPRRTSEFCEDGKKITRTTSRQTAPSPAVQANVQQSNRLTHIPVRKRSSSADRANILSTNCASASLIWPTPLKTPLGKSDAMRSCLTSEKHCSGAIQNDKRWMHDQVQRIEEFLRNEKIPGVPQDFFARGLRNMSTKEFVAIVNYFLHVIGGNRLSVGRNYVEDIMKSLQKLQYPHSINKSYLKTPTAQHSFGNVILMFDFLMDFVPLQNENFHEDMQFPFHAQSRNVSAKDLNVLDADGQRHLVEHAAKAFTMWDEQLDMEFKEMQRQTCDDLVYRTCGTGSLLALESEVMTMQRQLADLQRCRPVIHEQDEILYAELEQNIKDAKDEIAAMEGSKITETKLSNQWQANIVTIKDDIQRKQAEVTALQLQLSGQLCSVDERDKLVVEMAELRDMVENMENSLSRLQEFLHHLQVKKARKKKEICDKLKQLNDQMHEIACACSDTTLFDLPVASIVKAEDVERVLPMLLHLHEKIDVLIANDEESLRADKEKINMIIEDITLQENMNIKSKEDITKIKEDTHASKQSYIEEHKKLEAELMEWEKGCYSLEKSMQEISTELIKKKSEIQRMTEKNEETMTKAEEEYAECAKKREEYLNRYEKALEKANEDLRQLEANTAKISSLMAGISNPGKEDGTL